MKPPRRIGVCNAAAGDPLASLFSELRAGRLVALSRGEGSSKTTVHELPQAESAARLRSILAERVFPEREDRNPGPESQPMRYQPEHGTVLPFRAKETFKP